MGNRIYKEIDEGINYLEKNKGDIITISGLNAGEAEKAENWLDNDYTVWFNEEKNILKFTKLKGLETVALC